MGFPLHRRLPSLFRPFVSAQPFRNSAFGLVAMLLCGNVAAWVWAVVAFRDYPALLGTAFLAYSFGLRHAFDADHIAAIDNITRKLMQDGRRPVAVGFYFSLGHSSVVVGLSVAIAATAFAMQDRFDALRQVGGIIGTLVSAGFLFAVAGANVLIFLSVYRIFRALRAGGRLDEADLNAVLNQRGLLGRLFSGLFGIISRSWHMYPLGILFGLGFDTATEVGILGISGTGAAHGLPIWSILVFPALFTAGMTLLDTLDSILMVGAYGWAFVKPLRKLYYNLTITAVSVVVAILIGGIETLGLIKDQFKLEGPFWGAVVMLNDNFGALGYVIVVIFILAWIGSVLFYRHKRYDDVEISVA